MRTNAATAMNPSGPADAKNASLLPAESSSGRGARAVDRAVAARLRNRSQRVAFVCLDNASTQPLAPELSSLVERVPFGMGASRRLADPQSVPDRPFEGYDAVFLADALGCFDDDEAVLRELCASVPAGTVLVGIVRVAHPDVELTPPWRRGHSNESLDAMLVRAGWSAPTMVASESGWLAFEAVASPPANLARVLQVANRVEPNDSTPVLLRLASAAARCEEPSHARELLLAIASLRRRRREFDLAEQAAAAANAVAPASARPVVALGEIAVDRGDLADAEALFDHALGLDAGNVTAWRQLGVLHAARDDFRSAAELLECASRLEPSDVSLASELARMQARVGDAEGAARALERVLPYGGAAALATHYRWIGAPSHARGAAGVAGARPITGVFSTSPRDEGQLAS